MQRRGELSWLNTLGPGVQHFVFRMVALVFASTSAVSIYWVFSALGDDPIQQWVTRGTTVGFVALGYFVMRGLAHRKMEGQQTRSYVLIAVLFLCVEVICNFAHAAANYPEIAWIQRLEGWQHTFFSIAIPIVLSSMPIFGIVLAAIDVDLMIEKGDAPSHPAGDIPSPQKNTVSSQGSPNQGPVPQRQANNLEKAFENLRTIGTFGSKNGKAPPTVPKS